MSKDAFMKHTGFLTAFYLIGIGAFTIFYRNEIISNTFGAIILLSMAFISLLFASYYMKQTVCEACKSVYITMLVLVFFMIFVLTSTAIIII